MPLSSHYTLPHHVMSPSWRTQGGRAVYHGRPAGYMSGEGMGASSAPRHKVKIINHFADQELEVRASGAAVLACGRRALQLPAAAAAPPCTCCGRYCLAVSV